MIDRRSAIAQLALTATVAGTGLLNPVAPGGGLPAAGGVLAAGVHPVRESLSVNGPLLLLPGAQITVAEGAVLTLLGDFQAPIASIFSGAGRIDLNASPIPAAYPEWWGARTGDGDFDNLPALDACLASHPVMQLQCADYFIADTWRIQQPHRVVKGVDNHWAGPNSATRIVLGRGRAADADVIHIGPDSRRGSDDYLFRVRLSSLHLTRDGIVRPPSSGRAGDGPVGLRMRHCRELLIEDVTAENHATGFYVGGVVHSYLRRCIAARTEAGRGGGSDDSYGFVLDGNVATGFAGGNASIYLEDCTAVGPGRAGASSTAAALNGAFADSYLIRFECSGCTYGIRLDGLGAGDQSQRGKTGNADVHIILPILDQCAQSGIEIANLTDYGLVDIVTPYIAPAHGALAAIHLHDNAGMVSITGGQLIGWGDASAGGNAIGVHCVNMSGLTVRNLKILGHRRPFGLTACHDFDVDVSINNPGEHASQAAVQMASCRRGTVRARILGGAGVFPQGVCLDGPANDRIVVDVTGVDPAAIAGGVTNALVWNRTSVRSTGAFGTNLATGILT